MKHVTKNLRNAICCVPRAALNRGMTYVEFIVVLSIFSMMTSVVLFDYDRFQEKVDIKVLANDIAIKIVEAQKSALSGIVPAKTYLTSGRPAYGVYFDTSLDDKKFVYFTDLDNSRDYSLSGDCSMPLDNTDECLDQIVINKGSYISAIESYTGSDHVSATPLSISFRRPDPSAVFRSQGSTISGIDFIQITISSPKGVTAKIKVYPSGRVQID